MRLFSLALVCLACSATSFSQAGVSDPTTLKACAEVKNVPFPAADRPAAQEADALANCSSKGFYFGFDKQPDFVQARKCAYVEMDHGNAHQPFGGKTILMMVYANGKSVPRNYNLALRLACEVPGEPGDVAGRVRELISFKRSRGNGGSFSICDHSAGRYMYEHCAILDDRFDHLDREKSLDSIAARWSAQEKQSFAALRSAAAEFFKIEAAKGLDLSASFEVQERAFQERQFLDNLRHFEQGDLPKYTAKEAAQAEPGMNAAYAAAIAHKPGASSTVTPEGIKESQQEWLRYKAAWLEFAGEKYPSVPAATWNAWLNDQRTIMLQRTLY
jgi:hypothetical protein